MCKVFDEITVASARCFGTLDNCIRVIPVDSCGATFGTEHVLDVDSCPLYVSIDVHGKPWSFRDSESEIQRDGARNTAKANENTPAVVYVLEVIKVVPKDRIFARMDYYRRNKRGG